ncbi:hypothetical protein G7054_g5004 [Neopestalotiopsis clavispora]|nr:hypothetical protein G7054_g5004 [Neopestalotiopsis clavispora]
MAHLHRHQGSLASIFLLAFFTLVLQTAADSLVPESYLPDGISANCAAALSADTSCKRVVATLEAGKYYSESRLTSICTDDCAAALGTYHNNVLSSCASDTWLGPEDVEQPVALITEIMRYHYNYTCLVDGGRFCNNVAAAFAAASSSATDDYDLPAGGKFGTHDTSDLCDSCLVKNLAFKAGSPYYDGPKLRSMSLYESKTSSCGINNAPLTTTSESIVLSTATTTATTASPTCAGSTYTVQTGDDCISVSRAQSIATFWLLLDNDLLAGCSNFPEQGDLCLVNKCTTYTVLESDTCATIIKANGISDAQLRAWNPSIDAGCYNLDDMIGQEICIDKPGEAYVTPSATTLAPSTAITPAPVPTNIAGETNDYCGRYYEAQLGDYCNLITMKFGISLADFIFLNPAINENCTNLYAEESYCVQPVGDINTYSGKAGGNTYVFATATGPIEDSATLLPDSNWTVPTPTTTPAPLATGTREDCAAYVLGDEWQAGVSGSDLSSPCHFLARVYGVALEDIGTWNPSLGDVSDSGCAFQTGVRYCGKWYYDAELIKEYEADTVHPYDAREGMVEDCDHSIDVYEDGFPTCDEILSQFDLTIAQFYEMNPSVGVDCSGMWAGYVYCVGTPSLESDDGSSTTTTTASATSSSTSTATAPTPPAETLAGTAADCNKWHVVASKSPNAQRCPDRKLLTRLHQTGGDDCGVLEAEYGITHAQFLAWNTAVSDDCLTNFWGGYAYCVGTSSSGGSTTTAISSATTTTAAASSTTTSSPATETSTTVAPDPNQVGNAISTCNRFGVAQDGDWCTAFADRYSLDYAEFYSWNAVLGTSGENCGGSFWATYWYCIGVSA